jgi:hypothetical protein
MSDALQPHRHGGGAFELPLPVGWEWRENVEGCALLAIEPERDDEHLRANVVVTVERLPEAESLNDWSDRSLTALGEALNRHRLLDLVDVSVNGRTARRALSHYVDRMLGGVCLEQWLVPAGDVGVVVSCTTAALEYDDLFDLMHAIAEGLRVR